MKDEDKLSKMDDREFYDITRRTLGDRIEEASRETGIDLDVVKSIREKRKISTRVRSELSKSKAELKFSYQFIDLDTFAEPHVLLMINTIGVSGLSTIGDPIFKNMFLIVVSLQGEGTPKEAKFQLMTELTPIWHPQISPDGQVAFIDMPNNWGEAIRTISNMIRYSLFSTKINILNPQAAEWAKNKYQAFPLKKNSGAVNW